MTPYDAHALAVRLEGNDARTSRLAALGAAAAFGDGSPVRVASEAVGGGVMTFAGAGSPLTRARGLGMAGPVSDDALATVDAFFDARGCSPAVEVCPYADASLLDGLAHRGYRATGFTNVLVCALDGARPLPREAKGVRVARASRADAEVWSRVVASGFAGEDAVSKLPEGLFEAGVGVFHGDEAVGVWAFVDGAREAAGGGAALFDPDDRGLAHLFATSTRAPWRGRGVQSAIIEARLAEAVARGCTHAWVATAPGSASQRNLERAGFRVVYTRVEMRRDAQRSKGGA